MQRPLSLESGLRFRYTFSISFPSTAWQLERVREIPAHLQYSLIVTNSIYNPLFIQRGLQRIGNAIKSLLISGNGFDLV